jgi:Fe-S cluster assembly scaffold protein SufB
VSKFVAAQVPRYEEWLSLDRVRSLSREMGDSPRVLAAREHAHEKFLELPLEPNPLYRGYGYFNGVNLTGIDPQARGAPVPLPAVLPGTIRVVHDISGTRISVPPDLADAGVQVRSLKEIWAGGPNEIQSFLPDAEDPQDRLSALATATLNRGYSLTIPDGLDRPIRVQDLSVLSGPHDALSIRRSVRAGRSSQLLLTEEVYSTPNGHSGQRLLASSTAVAAGPYAKVAALTVHAPDLEAVAIYRRGATTGPDARVAWMWNGLGGYRTKIRNHTQLTGDRSTVDDLQTFYGAKNQSFDSSFDLTHTATETHGQSVTRGVFTDQARGMSRGLVRIEAGARKTVAYISEHAMLLSKGARSDTIPILEILCRDVKATHSTSVAPVDPEKVFYLESRGLPASDAIRTIGEGFLAHVLERAPIDSLPDYLYPSLAARWEGHELPWTEGKFPALPSLTVTGTPSSPDWRFDSKLR